MKQKYYLIKSVAFKKKLHKQVQSQIAAKNGWHIPTFLRKREIFRKKVKIEKF